MTQFSEDIYSEPSNVDVDTLKNLGPLRGMAGIWQGRRGLDVKPKAAGPMKQAYLEHIELQPIDPQTNGPQLLYGLRYHSHVVKPNQVKTYHDQVGYLVMGACREYSDPYPYDTARPNRHGCRAGER